MKPKILIRFFKNIEEPLAEEVKNLLIPNYYSDGQLYNKNNFYMIDINDSFAEVADVSDLLYEYIQHGVVFSVDEL